MIACLRFVPLAPSSNFDSAFCGCWFNLQCWRSRYTMLMRSNTVETAIQCYVEVLARFSSLVIQLYIYIYICVCVCV